MTETSEDKDGEMVDETIENAQKRIENSHNELIETIAREISARNFIERTKHEVIELVDKETQKKKIDMDEKLRKKDEEIKLANIQVEQALKNGDIDRIKQTLQDLLK